jgi:MOSC domain-containing protein YiiM
MRANSLLRDDPAPVEDKAMPERQLGDWMNRQDRLDALAAPPIELVSVNVGLPAVIGANRFGNPIRSGIVKRPATAEHLRLDTLNLEGDRQADLSVHGGIDKAVYAYPSEHLPRWNAELDVEFGIGTFGENLSTAGWLEDEVRIGDVWAWGDAILQVSQPRSPCYKLATVTGRPDLLKRLVRAGRTGWYLRVIEPGTVPVAGPIRVVARDPAEITVLDAHRALTAETGRDTLETISRVPALAAAWREPLHERLAGMPPYEPE